MKRFSTLQESNEAYRAACYIVAKRVNNTVIRVDGGDSLNPDVDYSVLTEVAVYRNEKPFIGKRDVDIHIRLHFKRPDDSRYYFDKNTEEILNGIRDELRTCGLDWKLETKPYECEYGNRVVRGLIFTVLKMTETNTNSSTPRTPKEALCEIADRLSYLFGKTDGTFDPPALKEIYEIACEALGRTKASPNGKKDKK